MISRIMYLVGLTVLTLLKTGNRGRLIEISLKSTSDDLLARIKTVQNLAVKIESGEKFHDIGSLCYRTRKRMNDSTSSDHYYLREVCHKSFDVSRIKYVSLYVRHLHFLSLKGLKEKVIRGKIIKIEYFFKWCDKFPDAFQSEKSFASTYSSYVGGLGDQVARGERTEYTAQTYQQPVRELLVAILGEAGRKIVRNVRLFYRSKKDVQNVVPPSEEDAMKVLAVYGLTFLLLTEFILDKKKFPFVLKLPHGDYYCFPSRNATFGLVGEEWDQTKYQLRNSSPLDFKNGKILELAEMVARNNSLDHPTQKRYLKETRDRALKKLKQSNSSKYFKSRVFLGNIAVKSFFYLLVVVTGLAPSQAADLDWSGKLSHNAEGLILRNYKWRSKGKPVTFKILTKFLKVLRQYLKLRDYMARAVGKKPPEKLFFTVVDGSFNKFPTKCFTKTQKYYEEHLGLSVKVTQQMFRSFKFDFLFERLDLSDVASMMQNSPETARGHYSTGERGKALAQMSDAMSSFASSLIVDKRVLSDDIPVGRCTNQGSPTSIDRAMDFEPDCKTPEGCFSCKYYVVHPDAENLKKLLSYKFVLRTTRKLSLTEERFEAVFGGVLNQVDEVIDQIMETNVVSKSEFDGIQHQVFQRQDFTPYWRRKMELLADIGGL